MYRDILDATQALFGEYTPGVGIRRRSWLKGEESQDDLADAWIRGEREKVLQELEKMPKAQATVRVLKKRGRKPRVDRDEVLRLRGLGLSFRDIAKIVMCAKTRVGEILSER